MSLEREWLETDAHGGFAMSTEALVPTRRYHGLLIHTRRPPVDRVVLINALELVLERGDARHAPTEVLGFTHDPLPVWSLKFADGSIVEQQFRLCRRPIVAVFRWRRIAGAAGSVLRVRPMITGRDLHALHFQNPHFNFEPIISGSIVAWEPYEGIPAIAAIATGEYEHEPQWRNGVFYPEEQARGFDCHEDYASPGTFLLHLRNAPTLAFAANDTAYWNVSQRHTLVRRAVQLSDSRRKRLATPLDRAADAYFVARGHEGRSIVAGFPWFNDWGRDTMIAVRGLGIARGRRKYVREVLHAWAAAIDHGMLPNHFTDSGQPAYNAMDAPLWFVVAAFEFLRSNAGEFPAKIPGKKKLLAAIQDILDAYARGTRHGIHTDDDGLLAGGAPNTNLTWMDARVDGVPATPRYGKPVEINALWINALWIGAQLDASWNALLHRAHVSFNQRFWLEDGYLADVIDAEPGAVDRSLRPNQVLAIGGLPVAVVPRDRAARLLHTVERRLYTPLGLRTLDPADPRYCPHYEGGPHARDSAYHQGTAWPWLLGPFVEAWLRVHNYTDDAIATANQRFVQPWIEHLDRAGLGHVSEIVDGDPPHTPRGCPFQAWSLGELLRVRALLNDAPAHTRGHWIADDAP